MRIPLLIAFIFISLAACAQLTKDITRALESRDLDTLDNYFNSLGNNSRIFVSKHRSREIIPGYFEVFPEITEYKKADNITGINSKQYTLRLLVHDKKIFYYNFLERQYWKSRKTEMDPHDVSRLQYKDQADYSIFLDAFQKTYNASLDTTDLFRTDIVYGEGCGIAGMTPPYMHLMTKLVNKKDLPALRKWLSSANIEKQLYAARAYRYLGLKGYTPTTDEQRMISLLADKKGFVSTCGGCIYSYMLISVELNSLKHIPNDMLTSDR